MTPADTGRKSESTTMQNSSIEWTDHTFNPWWGCQRVSPGCEHCYAETLAHRYNFKVWGPAKTTERREMSANYWKQPIKWSKAAAQEGVRRRVFVASMADVFEAHEQVAMWRSRLWEIISECTALDWLLLTKRPQNIMAMIPVAWRCIAPNNVWYGTSCEDQRRADERIPELLKVPAKVRFLSCEPLLAPITLPWCTWCGGWCCQDCYEPEDERIHWVIAGGESGHGARPMAPAWARSLRDQCQESGTAFHFKQWGQFTPYYEAVDPAAGKLIMSEYPNGTMKSVGKHAAGRLLDGRTWDEFPA